MITQVFTIYCHINRVNGKRYVGQTVDTVERWKAHLRAARDHRQTANQATLTSDQKLAVVQKAWATRREKYGQKGSKDISFEQYSEATKRGLAKMTPEQLSARGAKIWATRKERHGERGYSKRKKSHGEAGRDGWAKMTPEARAERVQKIKDGQRNVSRSEIAQDSWAKLTPEAHAERVQKIKDGQNRFFSTPEARAEHGRKVREGLRRRREAKEALLAAQRPRLLFNLLEPRVQVST